MITVIEGPPGAGKSTWVMDNAHPGDVVIDMDRIAQALWIPNTHESHNYPETVRTIAREARNMAVKTAIQMSQTVNRLKVFVIHADPSSEMRRRYRSAGARFVHLDPGMDVCIERVKRRNPTAQRTIVPYIREYYARHG
jgi:predicted ABC-type ATPase